MSISNVNVIAFVRSLIGEESAKYWKDTEITLYLQFAMTKVASEMKPLLWENLKDYAFITAVAGTTEYDAPTDFSSISHIVLSETGRKIKYISEDEWFKYADSESTMSAAGANYFTVWFMKNLDDVTDFPESCRALVAIEAAIMARAKNEDVTSDLLNMLIEFKRAALVDLTTSNMHQINTFSDFEEDDTLDPTYVWTWKGGKIKIIESN